MENIKHISPYGVRLLAIKQVLNRLLDDGYFDCHKKEDAIYNKAIIKFCISDSRASDEFMAGGNGFRFRNHKKDNKGKLVSVEAYLP
jgi:hypothetical protein|nr:MAG TPA: hypothetical protein [Caudoviricetes sp.]